ncbi:unnamed protein product [Victoria cruziana]
MNDLLSDSLVTARGQSYQEADLEIGAQGPTNTTDLGMENFFKKVREVEQQIDKISKQLSKLQEANEESKLVTKADAMKAIRKRMEKDVDEVGRIARIVKTKIEEIDRDNLANGQKPGCGKGSGVERSRTSMTVALKKKLKERMSEFQILRQKIQEEYREVIERRVFTVTGTRADEETIDNLIETGNGEQIFQKAIQEHGRGQIMDTLAEIQERHDAVRDLEKKLLDLQQVLSHLIFL